MPRFDLVRSSAIKRSVRVVQCESLFDVAPSERSEERWSFEIDLPEAWNVGMIVGAFDWSEDKTIVDGFPASLSIKDITGILSSVGFSSPPAWLRPFHVLSTGQQFRVHVARALAESRDLCVIDEFTSVVDRTVAQIGSAAVAKTTRRRKQKIVAVSCHYDIVEWLDPDWIIEMPQGLLTRRSLQGRPKIELEISRVDRQAWELFKHHHYLSTDLHRTSSCYLASMNGRPVAFVAVLTFPHPHRSGWREHRAVVLPDFQGVGIGNKVSEFVASLYSCDKPFKSTTTHPAMIRYRAASGLWKTTQKPDGLNIAGNKARTRTRITDSMIKTNASARYVGSFEYVGPKRPDEAHGFGIRVRD